mmetsp:Transcript_42319/g.64913  ORF Transcript_42319/g.64913 Transcript_42319/m.64913 type:complete len:119 (-) Transcript_42319:1180-1536(-)
MAASFSNKTSNSKGKKFSVFEPSQSKYSAENEAKMKQKHEGARRSRTQNEKGEAVGVPTYFNKPMRDMHKVDKFMEKSYEVVNPEEAKHQMKIIKERLEIQKEKDTLALTQFSKHKPF